MKGSSFKISTDLREIEFVEISARSWSEASSHDRRTAHNQEHGTDSSASMKTTVSKRTEQYDFDVAKNELKYFELQSCVHSDLNLLLELFS